MIAQHTEFLGCVSFVLQDWFDSWSCKYGVLAASFFGVQVNANCYWNSAHFDWIGPVVGVECLCHYCYLNKTI